MPNQLDANTIYSDWDNPTIARHNFRVICDQEGLTTEQKNRASQVVHCESGYNIKCVHPNLDSDGNVTSTDYGMYQINDYWHIGEGKDFPSSEYVMSNNEICGRWMARLVKSGGIRLWVCASSGLYERYTA